MSTTPRNAGLVPLDAHVFAITKCGSPALACFWPSLFLHLHTVSIAICLVVQIDMDFMNLNQSAHGDREAGFIHTRLRLNRKVAGNGHWIPD